MLLSTHENVDLNWCELAENVSILNGALWKRSFPPKPNGDIAMEFVQS